MVTIAGLLVLAAFVVSVIVAIVWAARRRQALVRGKRILKVAVQRDTAVNGSPAFDAAVAIGRGMRRARLSRDARTRKILASVAVGLSGLIVMLALAARFLVGDREAASVCAIIAAISFSFTTLTVFSAKRDGQKGNRSAGDLDRS